MANRVVSDQTLSYAASDVGLHYLLRSVFPIFKKFIQEAHGPRLAHLSDIATADMQMLCNNFPILSSQLI